MLDKDAMTTIYLNPPTVLSALMAPFANKSAWNEDRDFR